MTGEFWVGGLPAGRRSSPSDVLPYQPWPSHSLVLGCCGNKTGLFKGGSRDFSTNLPLQTINLRFQIDLKFNIIRNSNQIN